MSFRWSKFRKSQSDIIRGSISRRAFIGGAGAMLSLPLFESLLPVGRQAFGANNALPVRLLFYYVPNGMHMPAFIPQTTGFGYDMPAILEPLTGHRANMNVISGLANRAGEDNVPGDHARGTGSFLTCSRVVKTDGDGIQNGISVDQRAAQIMGTDTPFSSLQLGTAGGSSVGDCDSGYSCAYARNISWADSNTPLAKVTNPRLAFDRLFGGYGSSQSAEAVARRRLYRLSMLDSLVEDSLSLRTRLNTHDAQKLDEYLTGVRELEVRVTEGQEVSCEPGDAPPDSFDFPMHVQLMTDIMVKAFQCDMTRLVSFMLGNAGSNQSYSFLGVSGAHHEISHHQNLQSNLDKLTTIDHWEMAQFASLLDGLAAVSEGEGTLLDQSLVFFSSEIADGNSHQHTNLPIILAGSGGGASIPGRHIQFTQEAPVANLFISMLAAVGVEVDGFGMDGTGPLNALTDISL